MALCLGKHKLKLIQMRCSFIWALNGFLFIEIKPSSVFFFYDSLMHCHQA